MLQKQRLPKRNGSDKACDATNPGETKTPEVMELLSKVGKCIQEGRPEDALEIFSRNKLKSPWVTNANGVCLLRLHRAQQAINLFRGLVLAPGIVTMREDAPEVFKVNFAAALFASDNVGGCVSVLHEINNEQNPSVQRLRATIQRFRENLSWWKRLQWKMGMPPSVPAKLDFLLGDLE